MGSEAAIVPVPFEPPSHAELGRARVLAFELSLLQVLLGLASLALVAAPITALFQTDAGWLILPFYAAVAVELALRCLFLATACSLSCRLGVGVSHGLQDIVAAFLTPVVNLVRPFSIVRDLVRASSTDDLPSVRRLVARPGGFREAALVEHVDPPPRVPSPVVVVWQLAVALGAFSLFFHPTAWALTLGIAYAAQAWVFRAVTTRLLARLRHVEALAREQA